jgi:hypothetical protein
VRLLPRSWSGISQAASVSINTEHGAHHLSHHRLTTIAAGGCAAMSDDNNN